MSRTVRGLIAICAPAALLALAPGAGANSSVKCISDGSLSTHMCIRITYDEFNSGSAHYVRLRRVSAAAYRDDRQAIITKLKFGGYVTGRCYRRCQTLDEGQLLGKVRYPRLSRFHGGRPRWSRDYVQVGGAPHQCGVAELDWKRGRARHSYTADICFGLPIDQLSISDRERGLE